MEVPLILLMCLGQVGLKIVWSKEAKKWKKRLRLTSSTKLIRSSLRSIKNQCRWLTQRNQLIWCRVSQVRVEAQFSQYLPESIKSPLWAWVEPKVQPWNMITLRSLSFTVQGPKPLVFSLNLTHWPPLAWQHSRINWTIGISSFQRTLH